MIEITLLGINRLIYNVLIQFYIMTHNSYVLTMILILQTCCISYFFALLIIRHYTFCFLCRACEKFGYTN